MTATILFVDDEPDLEALVMQKFRKQIRDGSVQFMFAHDGLEALVLVHQDAEIADRDFCQKVRAALRDPEVGLVGCVGALDVRTIAWWEGSTTWGSFTHRYPEWGGGEFPAFSWRNDALPPYARLGEVEMIDIRTLVSSGLRRYPDPDVSADPLIRTIVGQLRALPTPAPSPGFRETPDRQDR